MDCVIPETWVWTAGCAVFCADDVQALKVGFFSRFCNFFVLLLCEKAHKMEKVCIHTLPGVMMLQCMALRVEWTADDLSDRNVSPSQTANKTTGAM